MADVLIEALTKTFDDIIAVDDLDLRVADGEFLVLVGPSGCGKSTTLRMIAGLEPPTAGRIRIGERDVTDLEPKARDIAMVFQNYALYPHMSVRENLAFGLKMRKTPRTEVERRVRDAAAKLGLDALLDRKPAALSGGQRQRVALGRAIVREPAVFLFDEPLSNLDAKLRVHTRAELVGLHRELGTTMVYVTHDQIEAMTMGQRIAVLHEGRLQQAAPPLEVYDRPANRFVAGFIGSPPMNFFEGRLAGDDGDVRFECDDFALAVGTLDADTEPTGRRAVLGVRPEHLALAGPDDAAPGPVVGGADGTGRRVAPGSAPSDDRTAIPAVVQVVEALGSETLVHCRTRSGAAVIARTDVRPDVRAEQPVRLDTTAQHAHLFDGPTGARIGRLGEPAPAGGA